ncbi:MAG: hypothetical protein LJE62_11575 [Silicimonas sp.]|jgi:hypothetical protein|nr:hypothetical protein [Silicimonas sp.]
MSIKSLFRMTLRDERGSFSIEAILMFPMLIWAFMAMYVFFEGLRETNINLKATYTVADLLSREETAVDGTYVNNMNVIYGWMARSQNPVRMRVSVVIYDEDSDTHQLYCSIPTTGVDALVQEQVPAFITPHVPIMADAASAIVVETWVRYDPIMEVPLLSIGLDQTDIYNIVVTAPRVANQFRCDGIGDGTGSTHDDGVENPDTI